MKTHKITTYSINELSDSAKETAHREYLSNGSFEYAWIEESIASVRAYVEHFGGKVKNWELGTYGKYAERHGVTRLYTLACQLEAAQKAGL